MTIKERMHRRFSEELKKELVSKIESGETTLKTVSLLYEVKMDNVKRWFKEYGKEPLPVSIVLHSGTEITKYKELEKESDNLKKVIGEQYLKITYLEQCLSLAKEKLGADFQKKTKL
jgi:transposase-like protein